MLGPQTCIHLSEELTYLHLTHHLHTAKQLAFPPEFLINDWLEDLRIVLRLFNKNPIEINVTVPIQADLLAEGVVLLLSVGFNSPE